MAVRYWCGDPFVPTMVENALKRGGWLPISYERTLRKEIVEEYERKIDEDFRRGLVVGRRLRPEEHFGNRVQIDVMVARGKNLLCLETKTKMFARKEVYHRPEYAQYHFDRYPEAVKALLKLPSSMHESLHSSCELLRYCLKMGEDQYETWKKNLVVLIPFYINPEELDRIPRYLKRLKKYVKLEHNLNVVVALWEMQAKLGSKHATKVHIRKVWKSKDFTLKPPLVEEEDILKGDKELTKTRYVYRSCTECFNHDRCKNILARTII